MARLQDLNSNFNPHFNGSINESTDAYAFIDESGDEGFDFTKDGVTKWFNVSAIMMRPATARQMIQYIKQYRDKKCPTKELHRMDSKELNHNRKKDLFNGLSTYKFVTTHSLFYKPNIDPKDNLLTYPSMYFVGVKNVIERISWATKQFGINRTHILISNRSSIKKIEMKRYLFHNSVVANRNLFYTNKLGIIKLVNFDSKPYLLLADYAAYTLRVAVEEQGDPPKADPYYFDWFQKSKLFSSTHEKFNGVWRCGIKCTPDDKSLIQHSGILDEGSHKF